MTEWTKSFVTKISALTSSTAIPDGRSSPVFDPAILRPAIAESFWKLAPQLVAKNPVMFVVEVGSVLTTAIWLRDVLAPVLG